MKNKLTKKTHILNLFNRLLPEKAFLKGAAILGGATAIGQVFSLASSLLLTRLYSPDDFGTLAIFVAIASQLLVIASFRYEWAIPLETDDNDAIDVVFFCIFLTVINTVFLSIVILFWGSRITVWLNIQSLYYFLWFFPVTFLVGGLYQTINYWVIRSENFKLIAESRLEQSIWSNLIPIAFGFFIKSPLGLIVGYALNAGMGTRKLSLSLFKDEKFLKKRKISINRMYLLAIKHYRFPTFSVFSSLLNQAGLICPVFFLTYIYGTEDSGSFSLAQRLISIPSSLVALSISQVFIPKATTLIQENPTELKKLYLKTTLMLLSIGLLVTLVLIVSPWTFPYIFGEKWYHSGLMAQSMGLMFVPFFIASPLCLLEWLGKQVWMLAWNVTRVVLLSGGFILSQAMHKSSIFAVVVSSLTMGMMYLLLAFANIYFLDQRIAQHSNKAG